MTNDEMLDKREDVLEEFDDRVDLSHGVMTLGETRWFTAQLLADEIVRLRDRLAAVEAERDTLRALLDEALKDTEYWINRAGKLDATLAALREPSEAVSDAAFESFYGVDMPRSLLWAIRAAVAAAEKEVQS